MLTQRTQGWLDQTLVIQLGDGLVSLGQHHLQHVDTGAKERPVLAHLPEQLAFAALQGIVQRRFPAQPGRQHQARLRPGENPRNRAQALDATLATLGRAAAQRQAAQLLLRRSLAEIVDE